jgi:hypothetical protein
MRREKKRKEKAEKNDIFGENNYKRRKKTMERKEIREVLEELRDELDAQPAWAAHESAVVYLEPLYKKVKEVMNELEIDTDNLKKAADAARKAESDGSDFEAFKALDDDFFEAMVVAYNLLLISAKWKRNIIIEGTSV